VLRELASGTLADDNAARLEPNPHPREHTGGPVPTRDQAGDAPDPGDPVTVPNGHGSAVQIIDDLFPK
jgi:hypothetical protein